MNSRFVPFPGYVYVIDIPTYDGIPLIKCGGTKRDPMDRLRELQYTEQFELFEEPQLIMALYVDDVWGIEKRVHDCISDTRMGNNELFRISHQTVCQFLIDCIRLTHLAA